MTLEQIKEAWTQEALDANAKLNPLRFPELTGNLKALAKAGQLFPDKAYEMDGAYCLPYEESYRVKKPLPYFTDTKTVGTKFSEDLDVFFEESFRDFDYRLGRFVHTSVRNYLDEHRMRLEIKSTLQHGEFTTPVFLKNTVETIIFNSESSDIRVYKPYFSFIKNTLTCYACISILKIEGDVSVIPHK